MKKIGFISAASVALFAFASMANAQVLGSNNQNNNNPNTNTTINTNTPVNTVAPVIAPINTNAQGQLQGQQQGQSQNQAAVAGAAVLGSGNSSSSSGVLASGNSAILGSGNSANSVKSSNSASSTNDNSNASNVSNAVTVEGDSTVYRQRRIPVSTAYAPALTSGIDTCLGSLSGGAQTGVFGISFGGTKSDKTCEAIKLGREAAAMGMPDVQCQILAQDDRFARALAASNRSCALPASAVPSIGASNSEAVKDARRYVSVPVVQPVPVNPVYK